MSLSVAPTGVKDPYKLLLQDPEEVKRRLKRWVLKKCTKARLYKDKSALLHFPQNMYSTGSGIQELPAITVTTTNGSTFFLHENLEYRNMVSRSWRRARS